MEPRRDPASEPRGGRVAVPPRGISTLTSHRRSPVRPPGRGPRAWLGLRPAEPLPGVALLTPIPGVAGSVIYQRTDLAGHCYYAVCSLDCHVVRRMDHTCPHSSPSPATATSLPGSSPSTPVQGCPNAVPPRTVIAPVPPFLGAREPVRGPQCPAKQAVASSGPPLGLCRPNSGHSWKGVSAALGRV